MSEPKDLAHFQPLDVKNVHKGHMSFKEVKEAKDEQLWKSLFSVTLLQAQIEWFKVIQNPRTLRTYQTIMSELCKRGLLNPDLNLQEFSLINFDTLVDHIKKAPLFWDCGNNSVIRPWSEATRQKYAAAFISFTGFLSRRTGGMIRKATPSKEGQNKTFYKIRETVKTRSLEDRDDWERFFKELDELNSRDCLIGKLILQGAKRVSEALALTSDAIDFKKGEITFRQSKTKGTESYTIITYRQEIMNQLREYLGERTGLVFVTSSGKKIRYNQIVRNFVKAGQRALISFKVTPHVLRATAVTHLKSKNISDTDIMKVTGHANSQMIAMYDKGSKADNASKKINLV